MLETKTIVTWVFAIFGIPATILGIFANYGTWKSDVLFWLSAILLAIKIAVFAVDKYQRYQDKKLDIERKRHDNERHKSNKGTWLWTGMRRGIIERSNAQTTYNALYGNEPVNDFVIQYGH